MSRVTVVALLLAFAGGCAGLPEPPVSRQILMVLADPGGPPPVPTGSRRGYRGDAQWPVSLHTRVRASRVARQFGLREIHAWSIHDLDLFCVVLAAPDTAGLPELVAGLAADPRVDHAQPVHEFTGMISRLYDDPLFDAQYGGDVDRLAAVHSRTTGQGVKVGIIDGGVDDRHPDLKGQIRRQLPPAGDAGVGELMHGTAVAGVIAAAAGNGEGLVGLAPGAEVTVYAACRESSGGTTHCSTVSLAEALERAIADRVQIVNLSLAGPQDWLIERLLRHARDQGQVLVAASNDADPTRNFPSSLPFVQAAGNADVAWFASSERFSTRAGGGYQVFFGSSIAAAGVTGMATLLRSLYSETDTERLLAAWLSSGCPIADASGDSLEQACVP